MMNSSTERLINSIAQKIPGVSKRQVFDMILGIPPDLAPVPLIEKLFNPDYCPGTFLLSERKALPNFLSIKDRIPFEEWVENIVFEHFQQIEYYPGFPATIKKRIETLNREQLAGWVLEVLEEPYNNSRLCNVIWNQEYDDILRRIEAGFIAGDLEFNFNVYAQLKGAGQKISFWIFEKLNESRLTIEHMLILSVLSGLVGVNHKTAATATSPIEYENIIPISFSPDENEGNSVFSNLMEKARQTPPIDDRALFINFLNTKSPIKIVFILDDFIESIFDLKLAELILKLKPNAFISIVPRWGLCGNDMSYDECVGLLNFPVFQYSSSLHNHSSSRLKILPNGPRIGGFNGNKMSSTVANALLECDILFVKGARNYEMMQGIKKDTFYCFCVCRELSESLTGIPAVSGRPVFIYKPPGEKTFEGFRQRNTRKGESLSGYGFAQMTALEFVKNRRLEGSNG